MLSACMEDELKREAKNVLWKRKFNPRLEIYSNVEPAFHRYQNTERETKREEKVYEGKS